MPTSAKRLVVFSIHGRNDQRIICRGHMWQAVACEWKEITGSSLVDQYFHELGFYLLLLSETYQIFHFLF